jgi:Fe2+ transport system protein FeoA
MTKKKTGSAAKPILSKHGGEKAREQPFGCHQRLGSFGFVRGRNVQTGKKKPLEGLKTSIFNEFFECTAQ